MSLEKEPIRKIYELLPVTNSGYFSGATIKKSRILIGRAQNCDVIINKASISSVHAILEVKGDQVRLFDMNSTNGTFVNDEKVIVEKVKVGDKLKFADVEIFFKEYTQNDLPPVLELLKPEKDLVPKIPLPPEVSKRIKPDDFLPDTPSVTEEKVPYVVYPLAADPKAEFSEYIFEDVETLYPIFKYDIGKESLEIMILNKGDIYSVDYLAQKNGIYSLGGITEKSNEIEFPYLGRAEKHSIVEIKNGECFVYNLFGYDLLHLTNNEVKSIPDKNELIQLAHDDIIKFSKGEIEIYIRRTDAPPKVAHAPIFRRDKDLKKYIFLFLLLLVFPLSFLQKFEVDKEVEKDKVPERIATILYKEKFIVSKKDAIKKTEKKKKVAQKSPDKAVSKNPVEKTDTKKEAQQESPKVVKDSKAIGKKEAKKVEVVKKAEAPKAEKKVAAKKPGKMKKQPYKGPSTQKTVQKTLQKSTVKLDTKGPVDVFKSTTLTSSLNSMLAKGGQVSATTTKSSAASFDESSAVTVGGGDVRALQKADVATDTGSLTGATVGKLTTSKGAEGLSAKKAIFTAGIPAETVVLGSMDPDIIRRILREHIPQFRFCYQKELDASGSNNLSGVVPINFVIGASGHVTNAGIKSGSGLPVKVQKCVTNVLYGIRFPRPMGGGTVEVDQPINFYPQKI